MGNICRLGGLHMLMLQGPETGLLAPDLVLYLRLPQLEIAAQRGGFGDERSYSARLLMQIDPCAQSCLF